MCLQQARAVVSTWLQTHWLTCATESMSPEPPAGWREARGGGLEEVGSGCDVAKGVGRVGAWQAHQRGSLLSGAVPLWYCLPGGDSLPSWGPILGLLIIILVLLLLLLILLRLLLWDEWWLNLSHGSLAYLRENLTSLILWRWLWVQRIVTVTQNTIHIVYLTQCFQEGNKVYEFWVTHIIKPRWNRNLQESNNKRLEVSVTLFFSKFQFLSNTLCISFLILLFLFIFNI